MATVYRTPANVTDLIDQLAPPLYVIEEAWPTIAPLSDSPRPAMDCGMLPEPLRSFVDDVARSTQTPADLPALMALTTTGVVIAGKYTVHVVGDWQEPVHNWTLSIAPSGRRKSAVYREVTAPLRQIESEARQLATVAIAKRASERRILQARVNQCEKDLAKAKPGSTDELGLQGDLDTALRRLEAIPEIYMPALVLDDVTTERVPTALLQNGETIAVMSAEGGVFENIAGIYSNGEPRLDVYLQGYSCDPVRVDRVARDPIHLERPAVSMGMIVQPDVVQTLGRNDRFRGRGLLGRYLYGYPLMPPKDQEDLNPPPVRPEVREAYRAALAFLYSHQPPSDVSRRPTALTLDPEALEIFQGVRRRINESMTSGELVEHPEWAAKLPGAVVRIAAAFHALKQACRQRPPEADPIDGETMAAALLLGEDYFIPHAIATFELMGRSARVSLAKRIVDLLIREPKSRWKHRDIHTRLGSGLTSDEIVPALNHLEDLGYIRTVAPPADREPKRGRKPGAEYDVNPHLVKRREEA